MFAQISTVAFLGIEARPVDVQVQIGAGRSPSRSSASATRRWPKAASGCARRCIASGLALPAKRITVNLAPADLPKEGSHYDLPIALAVMAAIGAIPADALDGYAVIGELALDGAISAGRRRAAGGDRAPTPLGKGLICPARLRPGGGLGVGAISRSSRRAR